MKNSICLTLFVSMVAGFFAAPHSGAGQSLQPEAEILEGRLLIIWVDDPAQMEQSLPPLVYLSYADGLVARVIPDEASGLALEDLLALQGRRVQVQGEWITPPGEEAQSVFLARSAVLVDEELPQASATQAVLGVKRWLSLMCKFADIPNEPHDLAFFQGMFANSYPGLDHYWRELSYDRINLTGSTAYGWITLPKPRWEYLYEGGPQLKLYELAQDCASTADSYLYFPDFAGVNFVFNEVLDGYAWGGATILYVDGLEIYMPAAWLSPDTYFSIGLVAHEMGHAFGLPHSSGDYGWVYDNPWDVMSRHWGAGKYYDPLYGYPAPHTIAYYKQLLGWISPEQVFTANPGSQTSIHLERLALPQSGDYLMVEIPKQGPGLLYIYTLEARRLEGYDRQLPGNAVIIHNVHAEGYKYATLVDVDRNGDTSDDGVMWTEGETFTDEAFGISVYIERETATGFDVIISVQPLLTYDCSMQTDISEVECQALMKLYEATGGEQWTTSWSPFVTPPCMWYGVSCYEGKVTQLWLGWLGLTGSIPPEIVDLEFLEGLNLSGNDLSGSIPSTITQLSHLRNLDLYGNRLSGSIPSDLWKLSKLETITLSNNELTGSIPTGLGALKLAYIDLANNQLSGPIPPDIGNLEELYRLSLQNNKLSGKIPEELGGMKRLGELYLGDNQLTGSIPAEFGGLTNLYFLSLENNRLSGVIPPELGMLPNLFQLKLSNNDLEGSIPAEFWKLCNLYEMRLDRNRLSGSIPPQLSHMCRLDIFDVTYNQLTGELSPEFAYTPIWFKPMLAYNGLQARHPELRAFLDQRSPGWEETQTLPPTGLAASAPSWDQVEVSWSPILYTGDGGYYEIGCAEQAGGPYQSCGKTFDKLETAITLKGMTPHKTYYLAVRSFTPSHEEQKNDLWSEYSTEVALSVPAQPGTVVFLPLISPGMDKVTVCSSEYCTSWR